VIQFKRLKLATFTLFVVLCEDGACTCVWLSEEKQVSISSSQHKSYCVPKSKQQYEVLLHSMNLSEVSEIILFCHNGPMTNWSSFLTFVWDAEQIIRSGFFSRHFMVFECFRQTTQQLDSIILYWRNQISLMSVCLNVKDYSICWRNNWGDKTKSDETDRLRVAKFWRIKDDYTPLQVLR